LVWSAFPLTIPADFLRIRSAWFASPFPRDPRLQRGAFRPCGLPRADATPGPGQVPPDAGGSIRHSELSTECFRNPHGDRTMSKVSRTLRNSPMRTAGSPGRSLACSGPVQRLVIERSCKLPSLRHSREGKKGKKFLYSVMQIPDQKRSPGIAAQDPGNARHKNSPGTSRTRRQTRIPGNEPAAMMTTGTGIPCGSSGARPVGVRPEQSPGYAPGTSFCPEGSRDAPA